MFNSEKLEKALKPYKQNQIIEALGISQASWNNKKSGRTDFKLDEIQKLGAILELTNEQLFDIFLSKC